MSYKEWLEKHISKHRKIVDRLKKEGLSQDEIIEYFDFDNMKEKEKDFCLLYAQNKKCHDIKKLNCYLCGCPYFVFNDNGIKKVGTKTLYSYCSIDAKNSKKFETGDAVHQDCSNCFIPHLKGFVKKRFDYDLDKILD